MWYRYPHLSPYAYYANNPVNRVVLDGLAYFGVNARVIENYGIDDQRERWTHYSWFSPPSRKDVNDSGTEIKKTYLVVLMVRYIFIIQTVFRQLFHFSSLLLLNGRI